jgi:hypothetical protein
MRMPTPDQSSPIYSSPTSNINNIQRKCAGCTKEDELVQKKSSGATPEVTPSINSNIQSLQGGGQPLSKSERSFFEPRMGQDFSGVRIHADSKAADTAQTIQAKAFTLGNNIVFNTGQYSPNNQEGKKLLAHELTHVVQQNGGTNVGGKRAPTPLSGIQQTGRSPTDQGSVQAAGANGSINTIQQTPERIQRLSVTVTNPLTTGTCGGTSRVAWDFTLSATAPADGYLVQNVKIHDHEENCPTTVNNTPASPTSQFWEAWPVSSGDTNFTQHAAYGLTDMSAISSPMNTSGSFVARGEIKFFTKAVTGDLGGLSTAPADPNSAWRPGGVPITGILPSVAAQPAWWGQTPTEGPARRWSNAWWNCCTPAGDQFVRANSNP